MAGRRSRHDEGSGIETWTVQIRTPPTVVIPFRGRLTEGVGSRFREACFPRHNLLTETTPAPSALGLRKSHHYYTSRLLAFLHMLGFNQQNQPRRCSFGPNGHTPWSIGRMGLPVIQHRCAMRSGVGLVWQRLFRAAARGRRRDCRCMEPFRLPTAPSSAVRLRSFRPQATPGRPPPPRWPTVIINSIEIPVLRPGRIRLLSDESYRKTRR